MLEDSNGQNNHPRPLAKSDNATLRMSNQRRPLEAHDCAADAQVSGAWAGRATALVGCLR